jgi:hypothetical protein
MTSDASRRRRVGHSGAAFLASLVLAACSSSPQVRPREYLDEHSAATVTVVPPGLTFARDRTDLAVHARDYFTLVPVDVNRMGDHKQYLYCMTWSTIDKRGLPDGSGSVSRYQLVADGRVIPLTPAQKSLHDVGLVEQPLRHPSKEATVLLVPTDRETLHYLSRAESLRLVLDDAGTTFRYELWSGEPEALLAAQ